MKLLRTAVFLLLLLSVTPVFAGESLRVAFLNPAGPGDSFFELMTGFMRAAAEDLGIELYVLHGNRDPEQVAANIRVLAQDVNPPEYVVGVNVYGGGKPMLDMADQKGLKVVIINQGFLGDARTRVGRPGEKYRDWLFELLPDDANSGYLLAHRLFEVALSRGMVDGDGKLNICAVNGHVGGNPTLLREQGLNKALKEFPQVILHETVYADWDRDAARDKVAGLLSRHPETTVIWTGNDEMALGVTEGLREVGRTPGEGVLTGGVDWATLALGLVENGDFTASVGGHFMDGGWALVMLYDLVHGHPVPKTSLSKYSIIDQNNVTRFNRLFGGRKWNRIDFRQFSKEYNPKLKEYDFTLNGIFKQF